MRRRSGRTRGADVVAVGVVDLLFINYIVVTRN